VARIHLATKDQANQAMVVAQKYFPTWRKKSVEERAQLLDKLAAKMIEKKGELIATQVLEVGKPWAEADGDVAEAGFTDQLHGGAAEARGDLQDAPAALLPHLGQYGPEEAQRAALVARAKFTATRVNPFDVFQISPVKERGWNAAILDARGFGESGGDSVAFGALEARDLGLWIDELARRIEASTPLVVWGRSMGAATTIPMRKVKGTPATARDKAGKRMMGEGVGG
jgi:hypothetical protein